MKTIAANLSAGLLLAALAMAAMTQATAQEYTFTTLAGPPEAGPGAIDGTASAARFYAANGVAVDSAGNVYVADTGNSTVRKVTPGGAVTTLAGLAGNSGSADGTGSAARFSGPTGVAVDSLGNVYVADTGNSRIRKLTPGGVVTTLAGLAGTQGHADGTASAARFSHPEGVAVDGEGNVYVADCYNHTIRKVTPGGVATTLAGLAGSQGSADGTGSAAGFNYPGGVAVDSAGNVYVADTGNSTVRKVTPAGVVTTLAGQAGSYGSADGTGSAARFDSPCGVAVDSAGNVFVADAWNHTIRKVTPGGVVTTLAGLAGSPGSADGTGRAARFGSADRGPSGVAVDSAGNMYVADQGNCTIRKVTLGGVVTTLAGLAGTLGSGDGSGSAARFTLPEGVAVDSAGNVYVADPDSQTIRKVRPAGLVTTLAGLPGYGGSDDGTGSAARFAYPQGVAADSAGNVYVADTGNDTIRKVTPQGVVATLAGLAGSRGSDDGTASAARFRGPAGVAVDSAGNVHVADSANCTVRKVTPGGVVTTLAGLAQLDQYGYPVGGSADGTGSAARFNCPRGVAADSAGNVYVADSGNNTIRKVTPGGVVTTLAGLAGNSGSADGSGSAARFLDPGGVAVDSAANVYVADTYNHTIRKVTPAGVVTTLAGLGGIWGSADGTGSEARFDYPYGAAVDSAGNVYVADTWNHTIRIASVACPDAPTIDLAVGPVGQLRQLDTSPQTAVAWQWRLIRDPSASSAALSAANVRNPTFTPDVADLYIFRLEATNAAGAMCIRTLTFTAVPPPPSIATPPLTQTAEMGSLAFFSVEVTSTLPGATYQWYFNGTNALGGATNSYLDLANVGAAQAGAYTVVVTDFYGAVTSAPAMLSVIAAVERRVVPALNLAGDLGSFLHLDYVNALGPGKPWLSLSNFTLNSAPQLCFDLSEPLPAQRFYRAWQTNVPSARPVLDVGFATEIPLAGAIGSSVRIDYINVIGPTDAWVTLATVTLTNTTELYFDLGAFRQPPRLYRLVAVP
ncbi:MAG: NHL repeat-containing protein [Verrucomicrobiota bacterium]|jgi:sugar lactone lactonase YvrE